MSVAENHFEASLNVLREELRAVTAARRATGTASGVRRTSAVCRTGRGACTKAGDGTESGRAISISSPDTTRSSSLIALACWAISAMVCFNNC